MADNVIKVSVTSTKSQRVNVSSSQVATNITAHSDTGRFWSQTSKNWAVSENIVDNEDYSSKYYANKSKESANTAKGYLESTSEIHNNFASDASSYINQLIELKETGVEEINEAVASGKDEINSTKTTILNDIEFVADGEKEEIEDLANTIKDSAEDIINRVGISMFDTILKDHVLTYEESKGLALQGTYVYKNAFAGSRYGYPDFYAKCLEEYNEATSTETVNGVTVKVHSNGHKFYDIANKDAIDSFFNTMGSAWFYGVDIENERIFLPRNNWFEQASVSEVGQSVEAGLPNITGGIDWVLSYSGGASGAFYNSGNENGNTGANYQVGRNYKFDASLSNSIYGNSNTVQPNAVKKLLYICVGNTTNYEGMTEVVNQGMEILEQVNQGIESRIKLDGSNAEFPYITETYVNGTSGYITYSNGYCEQWGSFTSNDGRNTTVTFLKAFSNTDYNCQVSMYGTAGQDQYKVFVVTSKASSSVVIKNITNGSNTCMWRACGYIA